MMSEIFFTSDEHYGDGIIIEYANRPFNTIEEMNQVLIDNHNEVVGKNDVTWHLGDFSLYNSNLTESIISKLNGYHRFVLGNHDLWTTENLKWKLHTIIEENNMIVLCHYPMKSWEGSHWNSWQLHGHSHCRFSPTGKQLDVGVDNNNFYPFSLEQIKEIMKDKPDNEDFFRS